MAITPSLETIVSLCKRRGFVFSSSEIYGGLNGVYDMGPLGTLMRNNIRAAWAQSLHDLDYDILFIDGAVLGPSALWEASGHVAHFQDPLIDCLTCKHRYRADDIDLTKGCPHCGARTWTEVRQFNMMFQTQVGASAEQASIAYLRPETAQTVFANFKNVISSNRVKLPFGIAQIGKAFRNEITPKQFIFRVREFEQMELEWFCAEAKALEFFNFWRDQRHHFFQAIGIKPENIRVRNHDKGELAHYSQATSDIEYLFPFGWKELEGVAYRGDFDLRQHSAHSGKDLSVYDEETQTSYIPHVVECSVGIDRLMLALLCDAFDEEVIDSEVRTVLRLSAQIAPIKAAFLPLTKAQDENARALYTNFKRKGYAVQYDVSGSIGRRYRRQDEIGTPYCFTYDFESSADNSVTVRHRDSMKQERIAIDAIQQFLDTFIRK